MASTSKEKLLVAMIGPQKFFRPQPYSSWGPLNPILATNFLDEDFLGLVYLDLKSKVGSGYD